METLLGESNSSVSERGSFGLAFISGEVLGSVFSHVSCTERCSERLVLSMHCRACGILVYEILQIEMCGATLGFFFIPVQGLLN